MSSIASSSTPKRAKPAATALRSHLAGALTRADVGREVRLAGWVHRRRDLGGLVFIDLRDRAGLVQLSCNPAWTPPEVMSRAAGLGAETVVLVRGTVELRPEPSRDPSLVSREVEVHVTGSRWSAPRRRLAIPVARQGEGGARRRKSSGFTHRVLDLRRPELQRNLILRHRLMQAGAALLSTISAFLEIETPILTKPTPEGARDYLVPSRVHPGEFYALPQSPQIYKQLLMVAGYDRYFQIARCFRDEDLRADRQPEFTQIDIEASFVERRKTCSASSSGAGAALWDEAGQTVARCRSRGCATRGDGALRQRQARPALRPGDLRRSPTCFARRRTSRSRARPSQAADGCAGSVVPGGASLTRKEVDELEAAAKDAGRGGPACGPSAPAARSEGQGRPSASVPTPPTHSGSPRATSACSWRGPDRVTSRRPSHARPSASCASRLDLVPEGVNTLRAGSWTSRSSSADPATGALVVGPPPVHRAASRRSASTSIRRPSGPRAGATTRCYNGNELGGGTIRITDPGLQRRIFGLLGICRGGSRSSGSASCSRGSRAGAPPHGGFAFGFDRIAMLLAGADSLRDVIAFPKTTAAARPVRGCPSPVDSEGPRGACTWRIRVRTA